jgi:CheY-like chemotaxis protein
MTIYKSLNVMVIDNDDLQLELVSAQLENLGIEKIEMIDGGRRALAKFDTSQTKPDLLICDIQMPDIDGFEFMKAINERDFKGGLILMSGQGAHVLHTASLVAQLSKLNFLGTVAKPVTRVALEMAIGKMAVPNE